MSDELEIHAPEGGGVAHVPSPTEVQQFFAEEEQAVEEPSLSIPRRGSLEERVAARRQVLEERHTELFDVPGFEDVFRVELKPLSFKQLNSIAEKHQRVMDPAQQSLRVGGDQLAAGTVAFHEIVNEDGDTELDENASWQSLYLGYQKALGVTLTDSVRMNLTPRAAIVGLLGPTGAMVLAGQFFQWATSGRAAAEVERDLARD